MSQNNGVPPNCPGLMPYLTVKSAEAALEFYQRAFGFAVKDTSPGPDGRIQHALMTFHSAMLMFAPEGAFGGQTKAPVTSGVLPAVGLYVYCPDVDALFQQARAAGATVMTPPMDSFWGDRISRLSDPDGHAWCFATYKGQQAPA
jgi:PhnB protein